MPRGAAEERRELLRAADLTRVFVAQMVGR
jgi:hypothetical protein